MTCSPYVRQQQTIDSSFTIEQAKTAKHTYIALNNAIESSIQLEKSLQNSGKFNEKQLQVFSDYLEMRRFPDYYKHIGIFSEDLKITIYQEVFDYITTNLSDFNNIVTNEMVEEFQERYQTYQEDAEKYSHETIEGRRDRLNTNSL